MEKQLNIQEVVRLAREELVKSIVVEEQILKEFSKKLSSVDVEQVYSGVYIPPDISLKAFCPEAYEEVPNPEVYQMQYDKMMEILGAINKRTQEYYSEAAEAYRSYQALAATTGK